MAKLPGPLWQTQPIEYLVLWKFPELTAFSWQMRIENDPLRREEYRQLEIDSEHYREELSKLPKEEFDRLLMQTREEENRKNKSIRENLERERWFNQPDADANFAYWAAASYWTPEEGVCLLLSKEPRKVSWEKLSSLVTISPFAKSFQDHREIVRRAIVMGQLFNKTIPTFFLAWAERMHLAVPVEMKEEIEKLGLQICDWKMVADQRQEKIDGLEEQIRLADERNSEQSKAISIYDDAALQASERANAALAEKDKRIAELELQADSNTNQSAANRERQSLLRLVIGMAIKGYAYDPRATRTKTSQEITNDLQLLGLTLDVDTVRKYLNEAKELLPGDITE
tara:strand:+ start:9470 stop:10495 length:1026 start_codon:yes stop_codon:yes gene_type:complete